MKVETVTYILNGKEPVQCRDIREWTGWMEKANRQVAIDDVGDVKVLTFFLGMDDSWGGNVPILFETMVIGGPMNDFRSRYPTWEDALRGHAKVVQMVKNSRPRK